MHCLLRYDYFIVSQSVRQGTVTPTHFNVICDSSGLRPDHMQRLTYKLCHLYYNWPVRGLPFPTGCLYLYRSVPWGALSEWRDLTGEVESIACYFFCSSLLFGPVNHIVLYNCCITYMQGTVRVPAPCQYAHKLAFLIGQSIHEDPSPYLSNMLYYLWAAACVDDTYDIIFHPYNLNLTHWFFQGHYCISWLPYASFNLVEPLISSI